MRVFFSQIYIRVGASFPFTHVFQKFVSREVSEATTASDHFIRLYGPEFKLIFNISAKKGIEDNEIKGPTVFRKTSDVEYSIFLPFDVIMKSAESEVHNKTTAALALQFMFKGVVSVLEMLDINSDAVQARQHQWIDAICSDSSMFEY